ncbi:hypothetical protein LJR239_001672 [Neorhizobium tomejilense]
MLTWDVALQVAYWTFWIAVFSLAINELIYQFEGYGDFTKAIPSGAAAAAGKYFLGTMDTREADLREQLQGYRKFTRNALMWSGPQVHEVSELQQLDEGLAYGVVVEAAVGFKEYNSEPRSEYTRDLVRDLLPPEVHGYLDHVKQLERIDRYMKYIAERIEQTAQDNALHHIRVIVLREVFEMTSGSKEISERLFGEALENLKSRAAGTPPLLEFLRAVKMEYGGHDSRGVQIGSWKVFESWLAVKPPHTFDDLLGITGLPMPPVPETPRGKTYYS